MSCRFKALLFQYLMEEITAQLSFFSEVLWSLEFMARVSLIDEQLHIQHNYCAQGTRAMLEAILGKNIFQGQNKKEKC